MAFSEVHQQPYLTRLNCEFIDFFNATLAELGVELQERYESTREDWIQSMVMAGFGISFVPEYMPMLPNLPSRTLVNPEVTRRIAIATVAGRPHSPAVSTFVRMARSFDWNAF